MSHKCIFCYQEFKSGWYPRMKTSLNRWHKEQSVLSERLRNDCFAMLTELKSERFHSHGTFDATTSPCCNWSCHSSNVNVCMNVSAQSVPEMLTRCLISKSEVPEWWMPPSMTHLFERDVCLQINSLRFKALLASWWIFSLKQMHRRLWVCACACVRACRVQARREKISLAFTSLKLMRLQISLTLSRSLH